MNINNSSKYFQYVVFVIEQVASGGKFAESLNGRKSSGRFEKNSHSFNRMNDREIASNLFILFQEGYAERLMGNVVSL